MQNRIRSEACRVTVVCVDSAEDGLLTGRLYNPYLSAGVEFKNLMQFLLTMETLLDELQLPQSFNAQRSFGHPEEPVVTLADSGPQRGKAATFSVPGDFPAKRQLAGICDMAGGRKRGKLPKRIGAGSADVQCHRRREQQKKGKIGYPIFCFAGKAENPM